MKPTAVSVGNSDQARCAPTPVTLTHAHNPVGARLLPSHVIGKLNFGGFSTLHHRSNSGGSGS